MELGGWYFFTKAKVSFVSLVRGSFALKRKQSSKEIACLQDELLICRVEQIALLANQFVFLHFYGHQISVQYCVP
jgi:hypothetical protein